MVVLLLWPLVLFAIYFIMLERWTFIFNAAELGLGELIRLRFGPYFGSMLLKRTLDLASAAWLLIAATLTGWGILRAIKWTEEWTLWDCLTALAIGVLVLGDTVLLLGLLGIMQARVFWVLTIASAFLGVLGGREALRSCFPPRRTKSVPEIFPFEWLLIALSCLAALFNLITVFIPELEYDALEYHLGAPKEWLEAGSIHFLPHNFYASMPSLTEMLYLWGIVVRGDDGVAKLLHWAFGVFAALAAFALGSKLFHRKVGLWAAAIFYTMPFITDLSMTARIDLATTFFSALAVGQAAIFVQQNRRPALWLAAVLGGVAFSTKYPVAPIVVVPLCIALAIFCWRERRLGSFAQAAVLGGIALLVASPWLLKNLVQTGNPFFPLLHSLFPSPFWDEARDALFVGFHGAKFTREGIVAFGRNFMEFFFNGSLATPLLLMLLPLAIGLKHWPPGARFLWLWFALAFLAWFGVTFRPWRFILPLYPVLSVLAAATLVATGEQSFWGKILSPLSVLVLLVQLSISCMVLVVPLDRSTVTPKNLFNYFLGHMSREEMLSRNLFDAIVWMNENLPSNSVVLYVGEARVFHAKHRVVWNTVFDRSPLGEMVDTSRDAAELRAQMQRRGITHIYWNHNEASRLQAHYGYLKDMDWDLFARFLREYTQKIYPLFPSVARADRFEVFELK